MDQRVDLTVVLMGKVKGVGGEKVNWVVLERVVGRGNDERRVGVDRVGEIWEWGGGNEGERDELWWYGKKGW